MKRVFKAFLFLLLMATALGAQILIAQTKDGKDANKKASSSGMPPLVDREIFFGNPEIAGAQLSPNGKVLSFLKPWKDTRTDFEKAGDEPSEAPRWMTTKANAPFPQNFWTRNGNYSFLSKT